MFVTLIICTYNRAESLKDTLLSLTTQKMEPGFDYEIMVVDNNSNDHTKKTVEAVMPQFNGRLRYLFESQKGKPYAINLGIKEAKGDIIAFTDDDCMIDDNDHLLKIMKAFQSQENNVGFLGGKILPKWLGGNAPEWIRDSLLGPLALLDYGNDSYIIDIRQPDVKKKLFYGANFAFRKEVFAKYGGFNVTKTLAQDTDICLRLLKAGVKGIYVPDIKVLHKVPTSRLTPQYFYQWFYKRGIYREDDEQYQRKFYHPLGIPFWLIKQTIKYWAKSLFSRSAADRIYYRCWTFFSWGRMVKLAKGSSK